MWRWGCQNKRFCFILFVFATEVFRAGLARGNGGWAGGGCHSGWRDLCVALGPRGHDCDAGLQKIPSKDPSPPPVFLLRTFGGCTKQHQTLPEQHPSTGLGQAGVRPGAPSPPARGGAASAPSLPLQSERASAPLSKAAFPLSTSRGQKRPRQPADAASASVQALSLGKVPGKDQMPTFLAVPRVPVPPGGLLCRRSVSRDCSPWVAERRS